MCYKRIVFVFSILTLLGFLFNVNIQNTKALTAAELQQQIAALQAQLAQLQQQLLQLQSQSTTTVAWCHTFNTSLKIGDIGAEITALRSALQKEGFSVGDTDEFDETIASAVVAFQEKYASEILTPVRLTHGNGFVGLLTRGKLNRIYGCSTCIQVITYAQNPTDNQCKAFSTPCDVPTGWTRVNSCADSTCTDTDNGKDYYTKGTVKLAGRTFTDSCNVFLPNRLTEYYCADTFKIVETESYTCPNGCENGVCKTVPDCSSLYWYDNTNKTCGYKQFCGTYMYLGLHTFTTKAACEESLNPNCIQVITYAKNPLTQECKSYPTPCDVPSGWTTVSSCTTCTNECTLGSKQCSGNGYQLCGSYDNDTCLEWGSVATCSSGKTCSNGTCITESAGCEQKCKSLGYSLGMCKSFSVTPAGSVEEQAFLKYYDKIGSTADCFTPWEMVGSTYGCYCYPKKEVPVCTDSDGGKNYSVKGAAQNTDGYVYDDVCKRNYNTGAEDGLDEAFCNPSGGSWSDVEVKCSGGCVAGVCLGIATIPSCTDSDGENIYTLGFAKNEYGTAQNDCCVSSIEGGNCVTSGNYVKEGICVANPQLGEKVFSSKVSACPNGCVNGACLPQLPVSISITSPVSGDKLEVGKTYTISWKSYNEPSGAWLGILKMYQNKQFLFDILPSYSKNAVSGSVQWKVSDNSVTGDNFQIYAVLNTGSQGSESNVASVWSGLFSIINSSSCTDSDGGVNYDTKGTVQTYNTPYTDYCFGSVVMEYSCPSQQDSTAGLSLIVKANPYTCPNGCENGACKPTPTCSSLYWYDNTNKTCGYKQFCGTYMYLGLNTFTTKAACEESLSTICPKVITYAKNQLTQECKSYSTSCDVPTGWTIVNTCTSCTDSDNGKNYFTKGSVTEINQYTNWVANTFSDTCVTNSFLGNLAEATCAQYSDGTNYGKQAFYTCPFGCSEGACLIEALSTPIKVVSPNGGETFTQGGNNIIKWTGGKEKVQIALVKSDFDYKDDIIVGWISLSALPDNQITWDGKTLINPIEAITPGPYKILLVSKDSSNRYCMWATSGTCNTDISNTAFNIATVIKESDCTDTDGGKSYYQRGTVKMYNNLYLDICTNGTSRLLEYFCVGSTNAVSNEPYDCPNGCSNGACIQSTSTVETLSQNNRLSILYAALAELIEQLRNIQE